MPGTDRKRIESSAECALQKQQSVLCSPKINRIRRQVWLPDAKRGNLPRKRLFLREIIRSSNVVELRVFQCDCRKLTTFCYSAPAVRDLVRSSNIADRRALDRNWRVKLCRDLTRSPPIFVSAD